MRDPEDILAELFRLAARQHGLLKAFVLAHAARWSEADVRRTARFGLAVAASLLRRLIHILARQAVLAPLWPRTAPEPFPGPAPRASRRRFRLIETPHARRHAAPNPAAQPDIPDFTHALFLQRLAVLAEAWRKRHRLARRLARRLRSGAAPLRPLCLPAQIHARAPRGVTRFLDALGDWLRVPDTS